MILIVLIILGITGCSPANSPLSQEAVAFKNEVGNILQQMQQLLAKPLAKGNIADIDMILQGISQKTPGLCINCPYRLAVLDNDGLLLTIFPKNEIVGKNFSSYKPIKTALQKRKISQSRAFLADGFGLSYISAPLIHDKKVVGVVVLCLTPNDLQEKWHLSEQEFLTIDFNTP